MLVIMNLFYFYFLGKGWENHLEGQKLKHDGDSFRLKLNTADIFDDWARNVQQRNLGVSGRIFVIENTRSRSGRANVLRLKVLSSIFKYPVSVTQ